MWLLPKAEEASSIISIILKTLKLHGFQTIPFDLCRSHHIREGRASPIGVLTHL
ncbi:hypothetical protein RchiOBHm_Chr5g0080171 [Rosa chinensis]|uniref:Uncharacterized protein n=1 Tax=Rosa chinensis TaxID=74649 RepID=A0A2P6QMN5_ROSCH|nr:hypothetical protein RchiOBHm_Chr5g0080171 [Rosa chinensis]